MIRNTLIATLLGLSLVACGEKQEPEMPEATKAMTEEVKANAEAMTEEAPPAEEATEDATQAVTTQ